MKGILKEGGYEYNFDKRCIHCNAYEVVRQIDTTSNLEIKNGIVTCKDLEDCQEHLVAENTIYKVIVSDRGTTFKDKAGTEVTFKEDWGYITGKEFNDKLGSPKFDDDEEE